MNRKSFITAMLPLGLSASGLSKVPVNNLESLLGEGNTGLTVPPFLKPGDTIGITCPGGFITLEDVQPAVNKIREWGYQVSIGATIDKKDFSFGGTDQERLEDLQRMLDDKKIKAVMCGRGGYGTVRIIDQLNFKKFIANPKWIIGFSDITVLHSHINRHFNIAGIHSKMCNSFPPDWAAAEPIQVETIESIRQCLAGRKMTYRAPVNPHNRGGHAIGRLVGGNLKTLESLLGSSSDLLTKNKLLFLEDTGEYLYSIDRMFWSLRRSGKLQGIKGLIIGGFKAKPDDPGEEFGKSMEEIVMEKTGSYNYPVCFDFPVGHQKNNFALKYGVVHNLRVNETQVSLSEL